MRPPARLTGELLARKGEALPATGMATATLALAPTRPTLVRAGVAASSDGERRGSRSERRQPAGRREDDRVALTLRLDRERHRRLRIFSARHDCSGQDVIVRALDAYLEGCSDHCACLRGETEHCIRN
jgi:hypothetical protein